MTSRDGSRFGGIVWIVYIRSATLGVLACLLLLLDACGTRTEEQLARVPSPDHKLVAQLIQVDPGGGATVGFTTSIYLSEVGSGKRGNPQFEGYSCGPTSISWKDDRTLQITYQARCHIITFDNEWWEFSDPNSPRKVELVLERKADPELQ